MKLWVDGKNGSAGSAIVATIKEQVTDVNRKAVSYTHLTLPTKLEV